MPANAYKNFSDRFIAHTGIPLPGHPYPCTYVKKDKQFGEYLQSVPTDQCVKMSPSVRMQGLWRNEFEGSQFCPAPAKECSFALEDGGNERRIWLDFAAPFPSSEERLPGGLYAVDFVGRRTVYRGEYGHLGVFDGEVIVDRMISIKEIEAPPPPPTKAETVKYWKECEAAGNCIPNWEAINKIED